MTKEKMNLRDSVTVFVSTVGYLTFDKCLQHLREQNCTFTLKIIDHVAPISATFQRMMDECSTPYYVQVDEDMLLYPHAITTLYKGMSAMDAKVAQYVCTLYDVHLTKIIYGIKIFRHEIVRKYPFRNVRGCEWDQIRRIRADGFVDVRVSLEGATAGSDYTLGLHGTLWTIPTVYLRFFKLELKRRMGNKTHEWLTEAAIMLLKRFLEKRAEEDFYALMGILAGSLSSSSSAGREKDYRTYDDTPGLHVLRRFIKELKQSWHDDHELLQGQQEFDILRNENMFNEGKKRG